MVLRVPHGLYDARSCGAVQLQQAGGGEVEHLPRDSGRGPEPERLLRGTSVVYQQGRHARADVHRAPQGHKVRRDSTGAAVR